MPSNASTRVPSSVFIRLNTALFLDSSSHQLFTESNFCCCLCTPPGADEPKWFIKEDEEPRCGYDYCIDRFPACADSNDSILYARFLFFFQLPIRVFRFVSCLSPYPHVYFLAFFSVFRYPLPAPLVRRTHLSRST